MFSIVLNFHFYRECVSHVPEITSIILKISRPLKLVLLFSELFDVKIAGVFTRRRAAPLGFGLPMLMSSCFRSQLLSLIHI